jgi:D-3-phosphoglycerate dehydrogenase
MNNKDYKVLIADPAIHPEGIELLKPVAEVVVMPASYSSPKLLIDKAGDVDAILARTSVISRPVIEAAPNLKIVSRHGVGVDSVDVEACTEYGVVVTITGDANSQAVSEYAFGCLLAVANKISLADTAVKAGQWERNRFVGVELHHKVLGLIGLGRIGSRMARQAAGFEMEVLAYDPYLKAETAHQFGVTLVDLETVLRRADFVSLHVPLTTETRYLIGRAELGLMKPSAILVNTARGGLIDEQALYEALSHRRIAGAALDVFEQEPLPAGHPLTKLDNLLCSPHVAGQTEEALYKMSVGAAENILCVFRGEIPPFVVNPEALTNTSRISWKIKTNL